jgi:hypothetical protein
MSGGKWLRDGSAVAEPGMPCDFNKFIAARPAFHSALQVEETLAWAQRSILGIYARVEQTESGSGNSSLEFPDPLLSHIVVPIVLKKLKSSIS